MNLQHLDEDQLADKCAAQNAANETARRYAPLVIAALQQWVGQPICKATGDLLAKVEKTMPVMPSEVYLDPHSVYSLKLRIRSRVGTQYGDAIVYVGDFTGGTLSSTLNFLPASFPVGVTPGIIKGYLAEISDLESKLSTARGRLNSLIS